MSKLSIFSIFCLTLLIFSSTFAEEVPHKSLNIPQLCTFGNQSGKDWGDDDFTQTIFFSIPEDFNSFVYFRLFDPDIGGQLDEIQGTWNTRTSFQLYGGIGAYTVLDGRAVDPIGNYKSGELIAEKSYGRDTEIDGKWVILAQVDPRRGELVDGNYILKLVIEGYEGDDGNLYKVDCSDSANVSMTNSPIQVFAYEWSFRLPNEDGATIHTFPFLLTDSAAYIISSIWDFDNDNLMYLNSPTRPGLPVYSTGNDEWAITKIDFGQHQDNPNDQYKNMPKEKKRWSSTTYDILPEDFGKPWTFQIEKGSFRNNDISLNVTDHEGTPMPMYSTPPPRTGQTTAVGEEVYEIEAVTTDDILFIERRTETNSDVTLGVGTVLPSGTVIAKGTEITQPITGNGGKEFTQGTVLKEDVIVEKNVVLKNDIVLKQGSIIPKDTQISKGSTVYEGIAPGADVLPPCNTVFLDASGSTDPDGNPLTFTWNLGDGQQAYGEKVIHTYRNPGTYIVSVVAKDNSGAINDAASGSVTITVNAPPISNAGTDKWACADEKLRFVGTKSYDPDGKIAEYKWYFGDGSTATGAVVEHAYKKPGTYSVRLEVRDDSKSECDTDADGIVVIVNDPPVAIAGEDINGCDYTVNFDATASYDNDGEITEYVWHFGDGNIGKGAKVEHTYAEHGNYDVKLVVTDNSQAKCNTGSDDLKLFINASPVAEAGPDRRICVGDAIYFDGTASFDPNGDKFTYLWNFGDDTATSTEASLVHKYTKPGKYTATLTLEDVSGTECAITKDTAIITVDGSPVANAGEDQFVDIGQTVQFDGSGSTDPNGYPLEYKWNFGDLSQTETGMKSTHIYERPGTYTVRLTVSNGANHGCNSHYDELTITVNEPPVARAASVSFIQADTDGDVSFDASGSSESEGSIIEYEWDFGDGTPPVKSNSPDVDHLYDKPGKYYAVLTVRDDSGLPGGVGRDTVLVVVNYRPIAVAGQKQSVCAGKVEFDGTGSSDPDGQIIDYEWDFGDGGRGSGDHPIHIYKEPGIYKVSLTVTDNSSSKTNQDMDHTTVEINGSPSAKLGSMYIVPKGSKYGENVISTCMGVNTPFDASASTDPNGDDLAFTWNFGDGQTGTGSIVDHVYTKPGRYIVTVTADDMKEMPCSKNSASRVVIVNDPPIAKADKDRLINPGDIIMLDGSASYDPDGELIDYAWDFGDGATANGEVVKHKFTDPGKYMIILTVQDDSDLSCDTASDKMTVTVNAVPIANAGADQIDLCSSKVTFDGSNSIDNDGEIVSYEWDFGDGSPMGSGANPIHTYEKPGTYTVTLKVIDDSKLVSGIASDNMTVVINDPPIAKIKSSNTVCPNQTVKFDGSSSLDIDGSITKYEWNFGDGTPSVEGMMVEHTYINAGDYIAILTVSDNSNSQCNTGIVKHKINVNHPPVAVAGNDIVTCVQTAGCSFTLDANQSYDHDGDNLSYYWDLGDGNTKSGIQVQHEYANPGIYLVTLRVVDDSGTTCNEDTDTLKVTANAPPEVKIKSGE